MAIDFSSIGPTNSSSWTCKCGQTNTGRFCVSCGSPMAASAPQPSVPQPAAQQPAAAPGFSLNLSKGMSLDLTKRNPGLTKIKAGLGWDISTVGGSNFDLDVAAFICHSGKILSGNDVVFFNNMNQPGIQLMGDNRTGVGDGDDEVINVDLASIPADVNKIVFVVTIFDAVSRRQTFGMVNGSVIRLCDAANGDNELCRFELKNDFSTETALIFAELTRSGQDWEFKAIGEGRQADLNGIAALFM